VAVEARPGLAETSAPAVILSGVSVRFGENVVLDNIELTVPPGEIVGLVGPSGSGKTTAVKLIVGLLEAQTGEVQVDGVRPESFGVREKRRIGYMAQQFSLFPTLTVKENLRFMASLYGVGWLARRARIAELLNFFELWDARGRLARDLSGGMQRRLSLAGAVLHRPRLLVVDEPTAGLDPALRQRIWEYLRNLQEDGTAILLTTQYIEEAERCDKVGILSGGRLQAFGSPSDLRTQVDLPDVLEFEIIGDDIALAVSAVRRLDGVASIEWRGDSRLVAHVGDLVADLTEIQAVLEHHGCRGEVTNSRQASFEEVFMRYTGQA
jgi:ABC-2 type transport system ATP-binding protein